MAPSNILIVFFVLNEGRFPALICYCDTQWATQCALQYRSQWDTHMKRANEETHIIVPVDFVELLIGDMISSSVPLGSCLSFPNFSSSTWNCKPCGTTTLLFIFERTVNLIIIGKMKAFTRTFSNNVWPKFSQNTNQNPAKQIIVVEIKEAFLGTDDSLLSCSVLETQGTSWDPWP